MPDLLPPAHVGRRPADDLVWHKSPEQEEIVYIRKSILRFKGDNEASMNYLKNVAEIESKGESLGRPSQGR